MSRKTWTLILCCAAQFMVILDVSIVNVALPSIRRDLGFSAVELQWVVNAYTLAFAGFLLLGGRAADLLGRRRVFVFGLALFSLASLAGGLSSSQGMLVAARAAQGLGGAVVAPATLAVLTTAFAEGHERNPALGAGGGGRGGGGGGARHAGGPDHGLRRGPRAQPRAERVGRHGRRGRRGRRAARRPAHPGAGVGVDLLRQRADRPGHRARRPALR